MFSAKKISPDEAERHRLGIDDFISKPVNPKQLFEAITKLLDRQKSDKRLSTEWKATGIPQETFGEYHNLLTSINVDTSLLVVMKKQIEAGDSDERTYQELLTSVAEIEERIRKSRELADELSRKVAEIRPPAEKTSGTGEGGHPEITTGDSGISSPFVAEPPGGKSPVVVCEISPVDNSTSQGIPENRDTR